MKGTRTSLAGEHRLAPLGETEDGRTIWPIFGAEDDDDLDDSDDEDEDDEDEDDDTDDQDGDGDDAEDKSKKGKSKKDDADDADDEGDAEFWRGRADRYKRRMEAADRRATEAERENRRLKAAAEKGGKNALTEQDKEDLKEAQRQVEQSNQTVQHLRLQVALLTDNTYQWHDPALVLKALAEDDTVEVDEDGKVSGVKQALRRLAKDKPYLIKQDTSKDDKDDEDDEDEGKPDSKRQPSGSPANGRKKGKPTVPDRKVLVQKFPALSRR